MWKQADRRDVKRQPDAGKPWRLTSELHEDAVQLHTSYTSVAWGATFIGGKSGLLSDYQLLKKASIPRSYTKPAPYCLLPPVEGTARVATQRTSACRRKERARRR
jgi:hypothetical protein